MRLTRHNLRIKAPITLTCLHLSLASEEVCHVVLTCSYGIPGYYRTDIDDLDD